MNNTISKQQVIINRKEQLPQHVTMTNAVTISYRDTSCICIKGGRFLTEKFVRSCTVRKENIEAIKNKK